MPATSGMWEQSLKKLKIRKMADLTAQQVNVLADNLSAMAQVVGKYRYKNFENLSASQSQQMKDLEASVIDIADSLYSLSATMVMDDIQESLAAIDRVTNEMKYTYETLEDIQKAIDVAGAVVTLGSSILSGKPQSIAQSINDLVNTWQA